ncbi:MAG: 50S ribosomal protein L15 [Myxococcota bacterium]|nr:50S ribosomal protein L15 [Myxococcota bacterium]
MNLSDLRAPSGANKKRRRVGRGESSGWGKTAGRGQDGQRSRSGTGKPGPGFEGGQTAMYRRMPKRGFVNKFAKHYFAINLDSLAKSFKADETVTLEEIYKRGLTKKRADGLRILGRGEITFALTVEAVHFSQAAQSKIVAAGGKATVV